MGHLHDLEHRFSGPRICDKPGDSYQGFWRKLAYKAELVLSDNDTPDCIFEGGLKCPKLSSLVSVTHRELRLEADLHCHVSLIHRTNYVHAQVSVLLRRRFGANSLGVNDTLCESKEEFPGLRGNRHWSDRRRIGEGSWRERTGFVDAVEPGA